MKNINKSKKLEGVCYDIRGPVLEEAYRMEEAGQRILKLNIGNPAPFGLMAPDEILKDVVYNLPQAEGYSESKGMFAARKAVMHETQRLGIPGVQINDIYLGNGVSELIAMALQGLCDSGDEILIPTPDYPLWTASTSLAGGTPVHYLCNENNGWNPDIADIRSKITPKTRAIVVINPNNPTGAVYDPAVLQQIVDIATAHGLIIFADEIYDKILYEDAKHTPLATLATDVLCVTFNGLSKTYRLAGFRSGWMKLSGNKAIARDYIEGLDMLSSMRLCANVPAQFAIQTALGGYQSINEYINEGGRLREQRDIAWKMLNAIPGVSCVKPMGALYMFPRLDPDIYPIKDDQQLALDLLRQKKILIVQGSGFNWVDQQHFRIVILPRKDDLKYAIEQFSDFIQGYRQ
ncbi:MAG: pyridoxal phosphate-dependent aminotransferase [Pseudomonadales bacterium]